MKHLTNTKSKVTRDTENKSEIAIKPLINQIGFRQHHIIQPPTAKINLNHSLQKIKDSQEQNNLVDTLEDKLPNLEEFVEKGDESIENELIKLEIKPSNAFELIQLTNEEITSKQVETYQTSNKKKDLKEILIKNNNEIVLESQTQNDDQIEDIDQYEKEHFLMRYEPKIIKEIYYTLFKSEKDLQIEPDLLQKQLHISANTRSVLLDWLFLVSQDEFATTIETYLLTVATFDDFISHKTTIPKSEVQLVGVACLHLCIKFQEIKYSNVDAFIIISRGAYTKSQLLEMERIICKTIDFRFVRPLSIDFLRRFNKAAKANETEHTLGKYLILIATLDQTMIQYLPSQIAAAAVYFQRRINNTIPYWDKTLIKYSTYNEKDILPIAQLMRTLYLFQQTEKNPFKEIFKLFSNIGNHTVSQIPFIPEF
ncbi:G2/mitotic-specific cyclin-B, putative [Entamoeba dispar SAW760]|uniref:G2/mitotic-specific cyclin-B, putative n=1 Tax=Entamoeba dispar (strain ATCC PRA-260 / SAW760) TaxID=370354 RepID=B0EU36_ENTDS|nr:G2/mitotic-specific cyclin-B, putative [Entamoeba dispar SAW760]EDR21953.1 G2/mitotic-specific cyclin-B, putative [Entamoeba dispar SAW760]|eukprot:EDR21953.1 G2/mitotic-specific cyclin-B, putative [Entamoeba dispar SAW760]